MLRLGRDPRVGKSEVGSRKSEAGSLKPEARSWAGAVDLDADSRAGLPRV